MTHDEQAVLSRTMRHIEELVQRLDAQKSAEGSVARELVRAVLLVHRMGLERLVQRLREAGDPGASILETAASDPLIGSLLLLHDLHPVEQQERVRQALAALEPVLRAQGVAAELVAISDGRARLRLSGVPSPLTRAAVARAVEAAVADAAPDLVALEFEGTSAPTNLIPASRLCQGERKP